MTRTLGAILLGCMVVTGLSAQRRPETNADRLRAATAMLVGLDYVGAEVLARRVIGDTAATRDELKQAWAYLGIALLPADTLEPTWRPETVDSAFRKLVELDPDATLPDTLIGWDGPKQRLEEIRRRTLAGRLREDGPFLAVGPFDSVAIRYRATRPARARLVLTGPGIRDSVVIERQIPDTAGTLSLVLNGADQPLYATGEYALALTLSDRAQSSAITRRYVAALEATRAEYLSVNPAGDPPDLRPTTAAPRRARALLKGLLLGGATLAIVSTLRGDGDAAGLAAPNPQGFLVAGGMTLAGLFGASNARPVELPENIRFNVERRDEYELERDRQLAENQRRRGGIRTRFRVVEEVDE